MTNTEILSTILGIPGAEMARANKTNFVTIPTDEGYVKISVTNALTKETKNHKPFNFEAAVAEYKAWEASNALKEAERANKPAKVKGPNPEAEARREAMDNAILGLPSFTDYTATDLRDALAGVGFLAADALVMQVGQSAQRLVTKGALVMTLDEKKKKHYTKA